MTIKQRNKADQDFITKEAKRILKEKAEQKKAAKKKQSGSKEDMTIFPKKTPGAAKRPKTAKRQYAV